jgi:mxaA protein
MMLMPLQNISTNLWQPNMTHFLTRSLTFLLITLFANIGYALDDQPFPDVKPGIVTLQTEEPDHKAGYTVGDILTRHIVLMVKKPYQLIPESLPIVGYEKKYRGQAIGIDLSDIQHVEIDEGDHTTHVLTLSYQVFTNSVVAKPGALPVEYIRLINPDSKGKEIVKFRIPSWAFVISPLSTFGQVKVEEDMSDYRGPMLIDASKPRMILKVCLGILAVSLLGLFYILGNYAWLPRMGGPFAQTLRTLRKLPDTPDNLPRAVSAVHSSLNMTAGHSLFLSNLDEFFEKKPAFKSIRAEFEQFFGLSRQVFFEPNGKIDIQGNIKQWLTQFCRRCRDCERGLTPESKKSRN